MVALEHVSALGRSGIGGLPERDEGGGHGRRGFEREVEDTAVEAAVDGEVVGKKGEIVVRMTSEIELLN